MNKKNKVIIQRITDHNKVQKAIKLCDGIIKLDTTEIICKGVKKMSKDIWTNKQQAYLDKKFDAIDQRFEAIDQRFEKLENQVKQNADGIKRNADGINQIIQILARNGMR